MSRVMMGLGDFRFEVSTAAYQRLQRTQSFRWEVQDRLGRQGAAQFTGTGLQTVDLEGVIYPAFRGGLGQVERMRALAAKGEPLDLVDGTGRVWGPYAIVEVVETQQVFTDDGRPRRVDFSVKLQEYGEDQA
jgi:phage protein U